MLIKKGPIFLGPNFLGLNFLGQIVLGPFCLEKILGHSPPHTLPPTHVRCSAHFFAISFHKLFLASLPPLVTQTPPIFYFFVVHVQCTYYVRHSVLRTIFEEQEQDTIPLRAAGTYEGGHEDWSPPCFQG